MGEDKAFIEVGGVPLWQRQLQMLQSLGPDELFIAGPAHDEWQEAGAIIIPDAAPGAGPLGGIVAGLRRCSAPILLTVAIDLPKISAHYLRELVDSCSADCGAVPSYGERLEPLVAVYPSAALSIAESCLAARDLSVQRFADRCIREGLASEAPINPEQRHLFLNMNTPDDLALASAGASHEGHKGSQR